MEQTLAASSLAYHYPHNKGRHRRERKARTLKLTPAPLRVLALHRLTCSSFAPTHTHTYARTHRGENGRTPGTLGSRSGTRPPP